MAIDEKAFQQAFKTTIEGFSIKSLRAFVEAYESARSATPAVGDATVESLSKWLSGAIGEGEPWEWKQEAEQLLTILRPYLHTPAPSQPDW